MKNISELLNNRVINDSSQPEFEFQQLALEMVEHFKLEYPSRIWSLFHKAEYTLDMIRESWFVYQKGNIKEFRYFLGILKNRSK